MNVVSASSQGATVELSPAEVIPLRNLLVYAPRAPLEACGPLPIFEQLQIEFQPIAEVVDSA
jgi:hypothetical protein